MGNPRTALWNRVYQTSIEQYTAIPQFGDYDARLTADIAADNWYESNLLGGSPKARSYNGLKKLPATGNLLRLGAALEVEWVTRDGTMKLAHFHGSTDMLWSDRLQAVLVLPDVRKGPCTSPPTRREAQLLARWARGRAARCSLPVTFNRPPMPYVFPCVQVSYRSDKFSPGAPRNYIHHIDSRGVLAYFSSDPMSRAPQAIMVRGGKLRLTSHGLAG
jgi:hypothetical protein